MSILKNKVQLIGNLGNIPEVRILEGGRKMARFSMATNDSYRNAKGESVKETQWHQLVVWGKTAELAEKYFTKGTEVLIEGRLVHRSYTDKEGKTRYVTEVQVGDVMLLGKREGV